ncbi:hypothetical protein NL676_030628 [Syzygium grande]|nr:hypothetical protein NL676_030628 [Syzygium grande]
MTIPVFINGAAPFPSQSILIVSRAAEDEEVGDLRHPSRPHQPAAEPSDGLLSRSRSGRAARERRRRYSMAFAGVVRPYLVGGAGGAAGGVLGGGGGRVRGGGGGEEGTDHGEIGRELEGEELALVEELVGGAEGGGGAGGERW